MPIVRPRASDFPWVRHRRRTPLHLAPQDMVNWYDPAQLARTGMDVFVSTLLGRHVDVRTVEALADHEPPKAFDFSHGEELWLDYASDTGDGWNSTFTVARALANPAGVTVDGEHLPRGKVLVLGGDEVYPTAGSQHYRDRFVGPFTAALPWSEPADAPSMFALPGNHDWYDSLTSFKRVFMASRPTKMAWVAGWMAPQRRSYFALKLPGGWWLMAADVQLSSDIDAPQLEYFRSVVDKMGEHDQIILCLAEPHWVRAKQYVGMDPAYTESNLRYLEERVFTRRDGSSRVRVFLAGDLHHYRRHTWIPEREVRETAETEGARHLREERTAVHKITAGHGGAFLHPTHELERLPRPTQLDEIGAHGRSRVFEEKAAFPTPAESRALTWRNPVAMLRNTSFRIAVTVVYALLAWLLMPPQPVLEQAAKALRSADESWLVVLAKWLPPLFVSPTHVTVLAGVVLAFWVFTDSHSLRQRIGGGTAHALAHVGAASMLAALGFGAAVVAAAKLGLDDACAPTTESAASLCALAPMYAGPAISVGLLGMLVGPLLFGLYLLISLNRYGRHSNEAFSSLALEDWKGFLRLRVERDGTLTIHPLGFRTVGKRWWEEVSPDEQRSPVPLVVPAQGEDPAVIRIDTPIVVR